MDMSKPRAFVEHPEHGLKMIYLSETDEYLAKGWNKPGEKPSVIVGKAYEEVKNNASDLSDWLNDNHKLGTNRRQGLKKLQRIANDYCAEDNQ